jgi:hypothetical protein
MAEQHAKIGIDPLAHWPDAHVERAWLLATGIVRRLNTRPDDDHERLRHLGAIEEDAVMFGQELLRRGLI